MKDGGPAFPSRCVGGMTLRDYFAAAALQGLLSGSGLSLMHDLAKERGVRNDQFLASTAYNAADSMLAERSK